MRNQVTRNLLRLFLALTLVLALPVLVCAQTDETSLTYLDGTYEGSGTGYKNGTVTVKVTITDGKITAIETVDASSQTEKYWKSAEELYASIIEAQSTDVDGISGATMSSNGIKEAVADALSKAVDGFSGGSGTETDPYLISSENALIYMAQQINSGATTYEGEYLQLTTDITLTQEWTTAGSGSENCFCGTFNGNGHTISDLTIGSTEDISDVQYVGLFGYVKGASITNLTLENVSIVAGAYDSSTTYAGAVYAFALASGGMTVVDSCYASGSITISSSNITMTGGLIGFCSKNSAIANCGTDVEITINTGGKIATCGGLVGMPSSYTLVMNSYALGNVTATNVGSTSNIGGLMGQEQGVLYNCYCAGTATTTSGNAGNLAGTFAAASYTASCYYIGENPYGKASGKYDAKTLIAKTAEEMTQEDFALILHNNLSSSALSDMEDAVTAANISGVDFEEMIERVSAKFYDWTVSGNVVTHSGSLWSSLDVDDSIFAGGSGTKEDPYQIQTADQLRAFAASLSDNMDYEGVYIQLVADIDVSGEEWTPIGGSEYAFNGTFDGAGYTISGMTIGSENTPTELDSENIYIGLFGVLDAKAVIKNLNLTNVAFYTSYGASIYMGGIAGVMQSSNSGYVGAIIDSCSVTGVMVHTAVKGNNMVGGLVGYQLRGAIINCWADVDCSCTVTSGSYIAEAGGITAMTNRGLIANCYSLGDIYGSASRSDGNEGMASIGGITGVNGGYVVGCYASGDLTTGEYSHYVGELVGWVTGIGKVYSCWYDLDSTTTINGQKITPVEAIGTKVTSGVNDEGDAYIGGLIDNLNGYTSTTYAGIAEAFNGYFAAYPIDIVGLFDLSANALKTWTYENKLVTFGETYGTVVYEQPECELVEETEIQVQDGVWYGRDEDKTTVVEITVENKAITQIQVLQGEGSGDAYEEALTKAKEKSMYGDTTSYFAADPSVFAGGSGTKEDPYQIATAKQLAYLSSSINEDVDWYGVYFIQTADIDLAGMEWKPIGFVINIELNGSKSQYAAYVFRGSYDGGNYTIYNLTIGSAENPTDQTTSGLFGFVAGDYGAEDDCTSQVNEIYLTNIHLENVSIYVETRYDTYSGSLLGVGQNGVYLDNCSSTGTIQIKTTESFVRIGGLFGYLLRGAVTNCWTDMEVYGITESSYVYAGGLGGLFNRATVINCYALGDVTGEAGNVNKVWAGGLCGQDGGIEINCYALGNVTSVKDTGYVGALNGGLTGIGAMYGCYYSTDVCLKHGDTIDETNKANGTEVSGSYAEAIEGKTSEEMGSEEFAALLTANTEADVFEESMEAINAFLLAMWENKSTIHKNYYAGATLMSWCVEEGVVVLTDGTEEEVTPKEETPETETPGAETPEAQTPETEAAKTETSETETSAVQKYVENLYKNVLGRSADASGLADWMNQLASEKATAAQVACGIILSDEYQAKKTDNETYVAMLYQALLNRDADESGYAYWVALLDAGVTRNYVLAGFLNSAEFQKNCESADLVAGSYASCDVRDQNVMATQLIGRLYTVALGRSWDESGLIDWATRLNNGEIDGKDLVQGFFLSKEFTGKTMSDEEFVALCYQAILGRSEDAAGFAYWIEKLANGATREDVLNGFINSVEFGKVCAECNIA